MALVATDGESARLFEEARRLMPGGVSSPVRAMRSVGREYPLFLARGAGGEVWDADGNRYVDWVQSWGPLIAGHAHPDVVAAVPRRPRRRHVVRRADRARARAGARAGARPCRRSSMVRFVVLGHRGRR